jgi:hypothetical protein
MFVDESKSNGFLLAAACYFSRDLDAARKSLRDLLLPGQQRLHFNHEGDVRRRTILATLIRGGAEAVIVQAPRRSTAAEQRRACLEGVLEHAAKMHVTRLHIEQDDSVLAFDKKVVFEAVRALGLDQTFSYGWLRPRQEPLLWAADGFAWAWGRGGLWRSLVADSVIFVDLNDP